MSINPHQVRQTAISVPPFNTLGASQVKSDLETVRKEIIRNPLFYKIMDCFTDAMDAITKEKMPSKREPNAASNWPLRDFFSQLKEKFPQEKFPQELFLVEERKKELDSLLMQLDRSINDDSPMYQVVNAVFPQISQCIDLFYALLDKKVITKDQVRFSTSLAPSFSQFIRRYGETLTEPEKGYWEAFSQDLHTFVNQYLLFVDTNRSKINCCINDKLFKNQALKPSFVDEKIWGECCVCSDRLKASLATLLKAHGKYPELVQFALLAYQMVNTKYSFEELKQDANKYLEVLCYAGISYSLFLNNEWDLVAVSYDKQERTYPKETESSFESDCQLLASAQYLIDLEDSTKVISDWKDIISKQKDFKTHLKKSTKHIIALKRAIDDYVECGVEEKRLLFKEEMLQEKRENYDFRLFFQEQDVKEKSLKLTSKWKAVEQCLSPLDTALYEDMNSLNRSSPDINAFDYIIDLLSIERRLWGFHTKNALFFQIEQYLQDLNYDLRWDTWSSEFEEECEEDKEHAHSVVVSSVSTKQEKKNVETTLEKPPEEELCEKVEHLFLANKKDQNGLLRGIYEALDEMEGALLEFHQEHSISSSAKVVELVKETKAHIFLAMQNLLIAIDAYEKGDFLKEGHLLSLHTCAIDAYVAIETMMDLLLYIQTGERQVAHDFSIDFQGLMPEYSKKAQNFLKVSSKGTLAVRYPCKYEREIPFFLKDLYSNKSSIKEKICSTLKLLNITLEIVGTLPAKENKLAGIDEVYHETQRLLNMNQEIKELIVQKPASISEMGKKLNKSFSSFLENTTTAGPRAHQAISQIELYLGLLGEEEKFRVSQDYQQKSLFIRIRNLFLIEKVYEELFVFINNTLGKEITNIHDLRALIKNIEADVSFKVPNEIVSLLEKINIRHRGHYLFKWRHHDKDLLLTSYLAMLKPILAEEGFEKVDSTISGQEVVAEEDYLALENTYSSLLDYLPKLLKETGKEYKKLRDLS